jgi:tripartite-type tricarboxylate transporter receptor subunit TctC
VTAVVAGQTEALSLSLSLTLPQLKAGKLRALAVTSARRAAVLPDVPTVNEQGLEGFDDLNWFGFFAPAGVRAEIVARLHGEIARALDAPEVRKKLYELGLDSSPNTPAEFAAFVRSEVAKWTLAVKDSGAKAE